VKAWAESGWIRVYNENDVAVALTFWCTSNETSEAQLYELGSLMRVAHLSSSFRRVQLPRLDWFQQHQTQLVLFSLAVNDESGVVNEGLTEYPPSWVAPARSSALLQGSLREPIFAFAREDIVGALSDQATILSCFSNKFYFGGYFWVLSVKLPKVLSSSVRELNVSLIPAAEGPLPPSRGVYAEFGISNKQCHAQLLAVTIRVIWLVGFSVEVILPCLVHAISWRSRFIEDSIFWF